MTNWHFVEFSLMRKSYDYGHFVVYILALILFSLFSTILSWFRQIFCRLFWYCNNYKKQKWAVLQDFRNVSKGFWRLSDVFDGNSWINMPYESHVTLFRWPFLSNKAVAVTWVQPKTPSDSFIRSIRVQTWIKIT